MTDLDKIINDLEHIEADMIFYQHPSVKTIGDTLKLLKEKLKIVRCKDCIHRGDKSKCILAYVTDKQNFPLSFYDNNGEWFCADGKQKDGDIE